MLWRYCLVVQKITSIGGGIMPMNLEEKQRLLKRRERQGDRREKKSPSSGPSQTDTTPLLTSAGLP